MRILWHAPPPNVPSAYGLQTHLFAPRLKQLGHDVVICRMMGSPLGNPDIIDGVPLIGETVLPRAGVEPTYELPRPMVIRQAFAGRNPDLVIVLKDAWVLPPAPYKPWPVAVWCNIDTGPRMGEPDRGFFTAAKAIPLMVSHAGMHAAELAGLDPVYIPHGIESGQWHPPADKAEAKKRLGLDPGMFIAGLNGTNFGHISRKGFPEQFLGFARFHAKHPRSLLLVHSVRNHPEGMDLTVLAENCGIADAVIFPHGAQDHDGMLSWYQALDVLMSCSYGEGFCVPVVEAHACGVPVIATDCSALTEKITPGTGWLVKGQQFWHPGHSGWWVVPNADAIAGRLELAARTQPRPGALAEAAARYDADLITAQYWKPFLDGLEEGGVHGPGTETVLVGSSV
jgi:glycosyltransferase involved in cell wall biosynthesis